ncbi:fructose-1,6-bisphosphatase, cytosolic [Zea mays]|uniref:fructose-1,6-bisphosphatase, cytosolic n=1 Tax=Zea mays TaxID=4577 RepID=UPI0009A9F778|nr:fructose-1,6-bisphosphatase, cytosolic [Zea mays]|eukprot:XP_008650400.2 fructose-1,6-bisphosphatase, cytosolic [Zea mays]
MSAEEAQEEIGRLQKSILSGIARYWETEKQIADTQNEICLIQDRFDAHAAIDDDEARALMIITTLRSCQGTIYELLVLSTGNGVNGFTLDPSLGEFILTHPNIKIAKKGKIYSVNEGNAKNWDGPTAKFVEKCKYPEDGSPPRSFRYIRSMVADVHRTLIYGGIFLCPADQKSPNGKLRLLLLPMSFLMEQAGGQTFTGKQQALELAPAKLHDRSPVFLGSYDDRGTNSKA